MNPTNGRDEWEQLVENVNRMHGYSDQINKLIQEVNERLAELAPGVGVWVPELEVAGVRLGYIKLEDKWQLVVEGSEDTHKTGNRIHPLIKASREVRYFSVPHLPKVFVAITKKVQEYADHMQEILDADNGEE